MPFNLDNFYKVPKVWGAEVWLTNTPFYCAKLLYINSGMRCSLHRHLIKSETFICLEGRVGVKLQPHIDGEHTYLWLRPGDKVDIPVGTFHRFWATSEPAVLLEVSSFHSDEDVDRLEESGPLPLGELQ